jgi:hypothetical protein
MGSMCCCEVIGFFWEFARGTTVTDTTRLIGYSSASVTSSYATDELQVSTFDINDEVTPVPTSGEHIWATQIESITTSPVVYEQTFYRFTMDGGKTVDGPYTYNGTIPYRAAAIERSQLLAIDQSQPIRTLGTLSGSGGGYYPHDGLDSNCVAIDGSFYAFWQPTISEYAIDVGYSGESFEFPYGGALPSGHVASPLEGAAYGWDGLGPLRINGWHVETFTAITNMATLTALYTAGYNDGPSYVIQGDDLFGFGTAIFTDEGLPPDDETGEFNLDAYGVIGAFPGGVLLGIYYEADYNRWERWNRTAPNYRILGGTAHTSKYVLAIRQELISDVVTLTSSTTDPSPPSGATAGTIKEYTRDWTVEQSLVIGTFDPDTVGVIEDDVNEPIRTLYTAAEYDQTTDRTLLPHYPTKVTGFTTEYETFNPEIDTRIWQVMNFPNLSMPTVDQWDISRDGERWCARVTDDGTASLIINGVTEQTTTLPTRPSGIAGGLATELNTTLANWAQAYNDDPDFDSLTDWPVAYSEWPSLTLAYSVADNTTNYDNTTGYRWYTISAGVLLAIDGPADLERAPQTPTANIDAILYYVERSYLPYTDTGPDPDRNWIRINHRFRIEFWGEGEKKGTTWTRPVPSAVQEFPVFDFAFSHGEYVYCRLELWDQDSNEGLGWLQVWRPRTMEYFYAEETGYTDLGSATPFFNLYRWPLPHNDWSVIEPRAEGLTWLPMNDG